MMTFDNYNTSTKDNNGGGGINTGGSNTATATSTANQNLHHPHHNPHTHQNPQHNPQSHYQQGSHLQPGGQQQQQQQQQQYFHHYDTQQPFNLPFMQGSSSPTHAFSQAATTGGGSTASTTPIWNLPFGQQSSTSSYYQPSSSIGASNRRNSSIDSTNIWSTTNPANTAGASGSNIWATSTNLQPGQQQNSQMNFPPTLENYISTSSIAAHNRSSSIPGFTSSPPPPAGSAAGSQQVPSQPQISLKEPFSTTPSEISPSSIMDPLMRRRSFTDASSSGGPTPSTTATTATSAAAPTTVISDKNTLQMVDDYFENDPHERVKVTLQLLNERFFDEEKFLGDAYQLPKFPIENSLRNYQLILVGFKAGRIDVFYLPTNNPANPELLNLKVGDLVIVEADRGRDLGKVFKMNISIDEARLLKLLQFQEQQAALNEHVDNILDDISVKSLSDQQQQQQAQQHQQGAGTAGGSGGGSSSTTAPPTLHFPKSVIALAQPNEIIQILNKKQDEEKACRLCLAKIANATSGSLLGGPTSPATQDLLQMKLIDAEYQFDRKKLIFYYSTSRRIDFRDLVRELFRIYKTRIWMCAVIGLPYQISSRRNSNSPLSGAPPQPTLTTATSTTGSATSGSSFINPFMQQPQQQQQQQQPQQQPSATTASSTTTVPTTSNSQYNINRLDRRLSFQLPPTYQQQGQVQQQTINYPQQQQGQIPLSYQSDFIPRRFSDSRSQMSSTWQQQQQPSQQQQYVIPTKYQFPPSQQQGHHHQTTGSISEILQPHSEEHSPGRIMNDENEQDRDGCEEFKDDEIMKPDDKDVDDIEVDEESFSNHSGESFVLKSLVDSINH